MPLPARRALFAAAMLTSAITIPTTGPPAHAEAHTTKARTAPAGPPLLRQAIADLPVAEENRQGYKRTSFRHWIDADGDGCSTRYEVLISEAIVAPAVGPSCALSGGSWYSYYDDTVLDAASKLDVDHEVPLAEAWDSGASTWDAAKREAYANYMDAPEHLVAVSARSNRQKADQDPSQWLPIEPVRCRYIAEWTSIKRHWQLSVDAAEKATLTEIAQGCPNAPLIPIS
ncbi:HNH endonuclease family protein [Nonomuraea sp. NPDC049400]|uniref:HNH endonuclease family protein n=1 Tax=Nonomuraea sp. NPDC049400 TaxID=3364352 RepID=UPI00378F659F